MKLHGLIKTLLAAGAFLILMAGAYVGFTVATLPDVAGLKTRNPATTALMEQRAAAQGVKVRPLRSWVSYKNISPYLRNAVLVAEDGTFFHHPGYDLNELKEAIKKDWREKRFARGASTITQQLAKNLYLSTSKNPLRKIREIFIALELERQLSKQRIFEIYLNVIEWGNGIYGIGPAAQHYFGKTAGELFPEEAAVLAAMIPGPRHYSPTKGMTRYLEKRKNELLKRLLRYNYLSRHEYDEAMKREVVFRETEYVM